MIKSFTAFSLTLVLAAVGGPRNADAHAATLYQQIGGEPKMRAVVDDFTQIALADDRINFTFAETDMKVFSRLLFEQLCNITQGPCRYTGRSMLEAHKKLNITNAMFNALAEDLYAAFDREKVPYRLQNRVMVLLAPMQHDVVKVGAGPHSTIGPTASASAPAPDASPPSPQH
ncbi:MAG TPA: group 1 truncated hemoglobin [Steroidobacteraceae bacterium]|nr:group 1 truncated hemoglobin [Steroidobacteraceae bacterium]